MGKRADELRGLLKLSYPIEHGRVVDWDDMELVWSYFYKELQTSSEHHPVLLTEAPLNPRINREKMAEIFFETFNVPALFLSSQAVLGLYSAGKTTGLVVSSGDGVTSAVPIVEGFALQDGIQRTDIAGRDVTDSLSMLLRRANFPFTSSSERQIVRDIKESCCQLSPQESVLQRAATNAISVPYKLPDGSTINIGAERFRAAEVLFKPSIIGSEELGVHELIDASIKKCDIDLRQALHSQIILTGGSTLTKGYGDRLLMATRKLVSKDTKIRIMAAPQRLYAPWAGGAILASLSTFKQMWISQADYNEQGNSILHKKSWA